MHNIYFKTHALKFVNVFLLAVALLAFTPAKAANPVITITGANPFIHQVGTPYNDLGATAIDENGNDISSLVHIASGAVNPNVFGPYTLTYAVTDGNGNSASASRTVIVTDKIPPTVVTKPGTDSMKVCFNDLNFVEPAVSGTDNYYPTVQITRSGTLDITKLGKYPIVYTLTDGSGNTITYTRILNVIPCTQNTVVMSSPLAIELGTVSPDLFKGVSVFDNYYPSSDFINGLNGCSITETNNINTNFEGVYTIFYSATNGLGNISQPHIRVATVKKSTGTTGIKTAEKNTLRLYPNPNNGTFEVEVADIAPDALITVSNIAGQVIKTFTPDIFIAGKAAIDLSGLATGAYFISIQSSKSISSQKFMVSK